MDAAVPQFETDIKSLFRPHDRAAMTFMFDLWDYEDAKANSGDILTALEAREMPCDGAWPADRIAIIRQWIDGGCQP